MKLLKKIYLFLICMTFSSGGFAIAIPFDQVTDWGGPNSRSVIEDEGTFRMHGKITLFSGRTFQIDPAKDYRLQAEIKLANPDTKADGRVYLGIIQYDKDGNEIYCVDTRIVPGSDTVLAADAKKGDTILYVKNASRWSIHAFGAIAYHTKPDYSDLPNRNHFDVAVVKKTKEKDGRWAIALAKPVPKNFAAGTAIRQHMVGGYMYIAGSLIPDKQWALLDGFARGNAPFGFGRIRQFAPGAVKFRLVFFSLPGKLNPELCVKGITLEIF